MPENNMPEQMWIQDLFLVHGMEPLRAGSAYEFIGEGETGTKYIREDIVEEKIEEAIQHGADIATQCCEQ